jgi:hypothetical protein
VHAKDERVLEAFFLEKPANRIIVNGPCSQGAVGYSTNLVPSMSLGCGPQAGNITSDNISARHLINVKRAAFVRRDWAQIEARDHERAAGLTKDGMPRGTGMRGDPALASGAPIASSSALTPDAGSNWRGNPAANERAAAPSASDTATPWKSKVAPAQKSAPPVTGFASGSGVTATLPTFSAPSTIQPAPKSAAPTPPRANSPYVGGALSPNEIQTLMSHAGSGCPLGPCRGCPHHEVTTGACTA